MRIRILSDLHMERYARQGHCGIRDDVPCDVVVLAGDIDGGVSGIEWAARTFGRPVVYVLGNHEHYNHQYAETVERAKRVGEACGVHFLEQDECRIDGVRFVGATLWSGLDAFGGNPFLVGMEVARSCADFSNIWHGTRRWTIDDIKDVNQKTKAWLTEALDPEDPAVVVTHFSPTYITADERVRKSPNKSAYFHNRCEHLFGEQAPLWICGHNHFSEDRIIEVGDCATRVVSNQKGYPGERTGFNHRHSAVHSSVARLVV